MQPIELSYYFGRLQREETEAILRKRGCHDGLYLLRQHLYIPGFYILSICFKNQIKHYKFERRKKGIYLGNSQYLNGPLELIEYLEKNQTGLITAPKIACNRFCNTEPVNYLFISTKDFLFAVEKEIKKRCKVNDVFKGKSLNPYKYEKIALKTIHLSQRWYHKNTNRLVAEALFKDSGLFNGKFLLRSNRLNRYKLCFCYENVISHYNIQYSDRRYSIQGSIGEEFESIAHLVDFYGRKKSFFKCRLTIPYYVNLNLNEKYVCDTNEFYNAFILDSDELLSENRNFSLKIPSTVFLDKISEGFNSRIFKALCKPQNSESTIEVAIKISKIKSQELANEYKLTCGLDHRNIVKIIEPNGTYIDLEIRNSVIIFEYATLGSFDNYLKDNTSLDNSFLINVLCQIASAAAYLNSKKIVHRDIAARNVLLFNKNLAKLSDFGLSRVIGDDMNYYCTAEEQNWPVKW